jgi:uncharacterized protein (DUF924 family)
MSDAAVIVDYWLADSGDSAEAAFAQKQRWYNGGDTVDAEIIEQFAADVEAALAGALDDWCARPIGALALVILLDQFTRTLYRGSATAFAGDAKALLIAESAVAAGLDRELSVPARVFLYHPYHHAESMPAQDQSIALLESIRADAPAPWHAYIDASIKGFGGHRQIVAQFGRYPHRNAALGRDSTQAELDYLDHGAQRFGQ